MVRVLGRSRSTVFGFFVVFQGSTLRNPEVLGKAAFFRLSGLVSVLLWDVCPPLHFGTLPNDQAQRRCSGRSPDRWG